MITATLIALGRVGPSALCGMVLRRVSCLAQSACSHAVYGCIYNCNIVSSKPETDTSEIKAMPVTQVLSYPAASIQQSNQRATMKTTLLAQSGVPTERLLFDEQIAEEARAVAAEAHDRRLTGVALQLEDGSQIELPTELSKALLFALRGLTQGDVSMRAIPDELTTSTAASILGVSRPTLMKLIESQILPSTKVGSHHRLNARDVFALREQREAEREKAIEELREMDLDHDVD